MTATPADIARVLRGLREVRHLPDSDPRRVAAVAEKHRVLGLIANAESRPTLNAAR